MKRVTIHQPDFLPYMGFFHRLLHSDVFIILDHVQFNRRGFHHRDKIKTRKGTSWITLPLQYAPQDTRINNMLLQEDRSWVTEHLALIKENYRDAKYFSEYFSPIEVIYRTPHQKLIDINLALLDLFIEIFQIKIQIIFSSTLAPTCTRNALMIELTQKVQGSHYLSGTGALNYLDTEAFLQSNIALDIQRFQPTAYPQLFGGFVPNLSCLDLVMNCGADSADWLRQC